nr:crosslink repair DNA glycosylase YcaQ family protein [Luteibacter rhizovicinus]
MIRLSQRSAQLVHLAAQGMLRDPSRKARPSDIPAAIARMGMLQIDTINVVARSPYFVLFSRLGAYRLEWLEDALATGLLAECWAHEACFVAAADYRYHRDFRQSRAGHWAHRSASKTYAQARGDMDALLLRVRENGPMRASDFERDMPATKGWWGWKPEKRWLEAWFAMGGLMVSRRDRFQRVYDLAERVLAGWPVPPPTSVLSDEAIRSHFIGDSVRALGVTRARWIADYCRLTPRVTDDELAPMVARGELLQVAVDGWDGPGYAHPSQVDLLADGARSALRATKTALLSPFDPIVWDRARALDLFDFEYTLECYTPEPKRRFGYFVLPILHRGRLVGRLDAKAHRQEGRFQVKGIWLEDGVEADDALMVGLVRTLRACAAWHGAPRVVVDRSEPRGLATGLNRMLARET